jgi:hypothetical protein
MEHVDRTRRRGQNIAAYLEQKTLELATKIIILNGATRTFPACCPVRHVVRRIGHGHGWFDTSQKFGHGSALGGIATEQAVAVKYPQISGFRNGNLGHLGSGILIRLEDLKLGRGRKTLQLRFCKAEEIHLERFLDERLQFLPENVLVPRGIQSNLIVGNAVSTLLRLRQVLEHDHGNFVQSTLLSSEETRMPGNDLPVRVDEDGIGESELVNARSNLCNLRVGVRSSIALVRG